MTAKEYLSQARHLDQQIENEIRQAESLRKMACSLQSPVFGERVKSSPEKEAPFVRAIDRIVDMETETNRKIDQLTALKAQIRAVLDSVEDYNERMILQYRYLDDLSWSQIGQVQNADRSTIYRRHNKALAHVVLPENLITI